MRGLSQSETVKFALAKARFLVEELLLTVPSGVLTRNQMVGVFLLYSHPDADQPELYPLQFPTKRRTASKLGHFIHPYKAKGKIVLKIEKVSEVARMDENRRRLSKAVYIRSIAWRILPTSRTRRDSAEKMFGLLHPIQR
uniref:SPATA6 domain-containing protein n=1 Tax=Globodera pallida TaxID=36090 RepID=A0A183CS25_GLOPA